MTTNRRNKLPRDSNKNSKLSQRSSPNRKNRESVRDAKNNNIAETDTSAQNQLGDRTEKMAASNTNPEKTEAKKANKTTESVAAPAPAQKSGSGFTSFIAWFAFALSVALGGGGYVTWKQTTEESATAIAQLQQQLESQIAKSQQSISDAEQAIRTEMSQTQAAIKTSANETQQSISTELTAKSMAIESMAKLIESSTAAKITAAEANLSSAQTELSQAKQSIKETQKRQESLEVSLEAVYARIGNTSREWVIAEADYLLKVANHRLQLEKDVTTSIQALTLADKRINSLSDPALNEVRNIIAQELMALQTLPIPDQAGVAMQLSNLQTKVDQLPLATRTQPTHKNVEEFKPEEAMKVESWQAFPIAMLDVLKGMVSVNYNDKPLEPLLSPEQVRNLHENLKLKLEQARIVLLRGDEKLYTANIDLAIDWTSKHFNTEEVSTKKFIDSLNYLKTKQVVLKTPDISTSLRTLRRVAKRLEMNLPRLNSNASNDMTDKNTNLALN